MAAEEDTPAGAATMPTTTSNKDLGEEKNKSETRVGSEKTSNKERLARQEDGVCAAAFGKNHRDEELSLADCNRIIERNEEVQPGAHAVCTTRICPQSRPRALRNSTSRQETPAPPMIQEAVVVANNNGADEENGLSGEEGAESEEVLEAKILRQSSSSTQNHAPNRTIVWLALLGIFLVGLGSLLMGLLAFAGSTSQDDDSIPNQPTSYPPFRRGLPATTVKQIQIPNHPLNMANAWMWNDPNRKIYSVDRQWQRFHMAAFYYFTGGDHWYQNNHWLSYDVSECDWFSQHYNKSIVQYDDYSPCDEEDVFIKLSLNSNSLHGTSPDIRKLFPLLQTLDIGNNKMEGAPPDAWVESLEVLVISSNQFEGQLIGSGAFDAMNIRVVMMNDNSMYGYNYGPLFAFVNNLEILDLSDNKFDEPITENLGLCTKLTHLKGGGNRFYGTIPTQLGLLIDMREMNFSHNSNMHGPIPQELGHMTNLELWDARGTSIMGAVPAPLCDRIKSGQLTFYANCSLIDCCQ